VARHGSPCDHRPQPLPAPHPRGPGTYRGRRPAVDVLLFGHAAVACTVAATGTLAVVLGGPVPTMHENLLAASSATEDGSLEASGLRGSVEPVHRQPEVFDPAGLVKAVRLEQVRAAGRHVRGRQKPDAALDMGRSSRGLHKPEGFCDASSTSPLSAASPDVPRPRTTRGVSPSTSVPIPGRVTRLRNARWTTWGWSRSST
jgi:hypothetical protein